MAMMPFHRIIPLDAEFIGRQKDAISQLLVLHPVTSRKEVSSGKGLIFHKNYELLEPLTEKSPLLSASSQVPAYVVPPYESEYGEMRSITLKNPADATFHSDVFELLASARLMMRDDTLSILIPLFSNETNVLMYLPGNHRREVAVEFNVKWKPNEALVMFNSRIQPSQSIRFFMYLIDIKSIHGETKKAGSSG